MLALLMHAYKGKSAFQAALTTRCQPSAHKQGLCGRWCSRTKHALVRQHLLFVLQQPQLTVQRPAFHWRWQLALPRVSLIEAGIVLIKAYICVLYAWPSSVQICRISGALQPAQIVICSLKSVTCFSQPASAHRRPTIRKVWRSRSCPRHLLQQFTDVLVVSIPCKGDGVVTSLPADNICSQL